MRNSARDTVLWLGVYVVLVTGPLAVATLGDVPPSRGFWMEFGVALGFVGLAMMWLQFALTARFRWIAPRFGLDTLLQFHRQAGLVAFAFVLAHPLVLFAVDVEYVQFLNPLGGLTELARALALWAVMGALVLLLGSTLWRESVGIPYEWWRLAHAGLAFLIVFVGLVHVLRVGFYIDDLWKQAVWVGLTAAAMGLLVHTRVVRPWRQLQRPYEVVDVTPERGTSWTLTLQAVGHNGMPFAPGQFAWLTIGNTPYALEQHPFSMSSSAARPERISFTIKELGDFTRRVGQVRVGTRAFVDGPYGAFTLDEAADDGVVLIAGGVGVTPMMSILRTAADGGDRRTFTLIYAAGALDTMAFRDELEGLQSRLRLDLVLVPYSRPAEWERPSGALDAAGLAGLLPNDARGSFRYLVCGPPGLMDVAERLLRSRGVPPRQINVERFDIA